MEFIFSFETGKQYDRYLDNCRLYIELKIEGFIYVCERIYLQNSSEKLEHNEKSIIRPFVCHIKAQIRFQNKKNIF